jgi:hypothetical protein
MNLVLSILACLAVIASLVLTILFRRWHEQDTREDKLNKINEDTSHAQKSVDDWTDRKPDAS